MLEFNIDNWHETLLRTPGYYRHLKRYVDDNDSKIQHLKSITDIIVDIPNNKENIPMEVPIYDYDSNESKKWHLDEIAEAFYHYSNQMLVIFSSYLELIIQDFFETLFYYQPEKMYEYISTNANNELNGYIELKLVLNSSSIDELKTQLVKRAASNANKGDILKIIKRIEILCKDSFDEKYKNNLKTLVEHRNKVVHEDTLFDVNEIIVDRTADNIMSFLRFLSLILLKNKIPIVDNGRLTS